MTTWRKVGCCLAMVAGLSFGAFGYSDEYLDIELGDNAVVSHCEVEGRQVYVFTNAANVTVSSTITLKQTMTLQEKLILGGGGAGADLKGGGGGGGGVIFDTGAQMCDAGSEIAVTVGAGGIGDITRVTAARGAASSCTVAGVTQTAFGGGGGGSDADGAAGKPSTGGSLGSGGGAGKNLSVYNVSGEDYTEGQGHPGGNSSGGAGGGGGYSQRGEDGKSGLSGRGGEGLTNAITGVSQVYGSGGGGGSGNPQSGTAECNVGGTNAGDGGSREVTDDYPYGQPGGNAVPGFGGGGGGGGYQKGADPLSRPKGGDGGSGTVILSFSVGGTSGKPVIEPSDITIGFPDGFTQPYVSVVPRAEPGAVYVAKVTILCGTGPLAEAGVAYAATNVYFEVHKGEQVGGYAAVWPQPGETLYVRVVAEAADVEDTVTDTSAEVTGTVPAYAGKGGGPGVIHVRPGATGRGDGTSWANAYVDFRAAIRELSAERPELWFAGDEQCFASSAEAIAPPCAATIRGGFVGTENSAAERAPGARSLVDGRSQYTCFTVTNLHALTMDSFEICRGAGRGISKSQSGDITVTNCFVWSCGSSDTSGRAIYISGSAAATRATVTDCVVSNHYFSGYGTAGNGPLHLATLAGATVSRCLFTHNGLAFGSVPGLDCMSADALPGRDNGWGAALAVVDAPVALADCQFRVNVAPTTRHGNNQSGGIAVLRGACGGSIVRNCAFIGNENLYGETSEKNPDEEAGALVVRLSATTDVARVENCTFTRNLYAGMSGGCALNVVKGDVTVRNCIFYGNLCGPADAHYPESIRVQTNSTARVSYTLLDGPDACRADAGGTVERGEGCFTDDPLFASSFSAFGSSIVTNGAGVYFTAAAVAPSMAFNVHLKSRNGYFDETAREIVRWSKTRSPAVDKGDPAVKCVEPSPNGRRVNLGFYGNTPFATMSQSGMTLIVR